MDYLPHVDQVIYLRGIRRRMDYKTGIAGLKAPISYSWLSQLVEVRRDERSHVPVPDRLTREQLRAVFRRLERRGLIRWIRDHGGRGLVFECLLADRDPSVQNQNNPRATRENLDQRNPESTPQNNPKNSRLHNGLQGMSNPKNNPQSNPRATRANIDQNNPIPVSGIQNPPSGDLYTSPRAGGERESTPQSTAKPASRFDAFWAAYPKKVGKKPCREKWRAKKLDRIADRIIADVERRKREHRPWLQGFVPNPLTYLNQERWEDEIEPASQLPAPEPHRSETPRDDLLSPRSRAAVNEAVRQFRAGRRVVGGKG
ncbi:MAG TPA: hypothetical protein ENK57_24675 [Polyangiaceae bacterium]|nr:hypothetical protein [Polyangiaceae bacterium]